MQIVEDAIGETFDCLINGSYAHQLTFKGNCAVSITDADGTRDVSTWTIVDGGTVLLVEGRACFKVRDGKLVSGEDEYIGTLVK